MPQRSPRYLFPCCRGSCILSVYHSLGMIYEIRRLDKNSEAKNKVHDPFSGNSRNINGGWTEAAKPMRLFFFQLMSVNNSKNRRFTLEKIKVENEVWDDMLGMKN
ncbi:hypothetical protein CEXT_32791 [Caerostris extrusa]|uniref:Uncharacterized protein n=1 Tax=Caerostris extrusa TaxID=172846 RepID=A0AAV4SKV7_CAEEX|nr:hypothetical protein CEXT_32791 [Caerostris extrusa]